MCRLIVCHNANVTKCNSIYFAIVFNLCIFAAQMKKIINYDK